MTKLTKQQIKDRDDLASRLKDTRAKLDIAVTAMNSAISLAFSEFVAPAMEAYNEAIGDANSWRIDIAAEIQDGFDEKSEKWQESDKGQAVSSWKDTWEDEFELAEIEEPEAVELDLEDAAEALEQLPEECEG